jgi:hypothetical protein
MIIYNVTINIEDSVHDEWLQWQREVHIPDVLRSGLFLESRMSKVLADEGTDGHTYSIQYLCRSMDDFHKYEELFAPRLRQEANERYIGKMVAFRTLLEVVEDFSL